MSGRLDLSLVIATYDRPALLAETIVSCQAQRNRLGMTIEILVVDNHPSQNGRPIAEAAAGRATFPVRYVVEPTRNMSVLRNRGFAEFLKFLLADLLRAAKDEKQRPPLQHSLVIGVLEEGDQAGPTRGAMSVHPAAFLNEAEAKASFVAGRLIASPGDREVAFVAVIDEGPVVQSSINRLPVTTIH